MRFTLDRVHPIMPSTMRVRRAVRTADADQPGIREGTTMSRWVLAVLVLGATGAWALDITTCSVTVPSGETGVLQVDLDCQPGDLHAVALEDRAALDLNGHTVTNPRHFASGAAVRCFGRCTVVGPGLISGGPFREFDGIRADASLLPAHPVRLELRDLTIDATRIGIEGNVAGAAVRATNVTVTNCDPYGFYVPRVRAEDVTATGSDIGVYARSLRALNLNASDNVSYGVYALRTVVAQGLIATNNVEEGVRSDGRLRLVDSTVTGNDAAGEGIDIESARRPRLENTTCGRSEMTGPPFGDWDVCTND